MGIPIEAARPLRSAIYKGWVWHHRYSPKVHKFRYQVFMMYLDLSEIDSVLSLSKFWGQKWYHLARFQRSNYFAIDRNYEQSIEAAVRVEVQQQLGFELAGPVCLLTNFKYFGYVTNPISCYYCFDEQGSTLIALLVEVTNTPWGEKHHYVLDLTSVSEDHAVDFEKKMHVSPFMPMNRIYRWRGALPAKTLRYSLASVLQPAEGDVIGVDSPTDAAAGLDSEQVQFDSGVIFKYSKINANTLNGLLLRFPFMTLQIVFAIYWQALKLWIKKIPFVQHPNKQADTNAV